MQEPLGRPRPTLPPTATGTHLAAFTWTEWELLVGIALIWGSSFLFIEVGLEAFAPGVVTMARVVLGAATLGLFRKAREGVDRADLPRISLLGLVWIAVPLTLFPIAQQWIDSAVSGMINGAVPIAAAIWATLLLRRPPGRRQLLGIAVGFAGVVAVFLPELATSTASAVGATLALVAVIMYGLAANLAVPLQQKYGALPVLLRAQLVALVLVVPVGLLQVGDSSWEWPSAVAMIPLGALGTGVAFVFMATLVGRVGAPRGAIAIYFVPLVAVALGVAVLGEEVAWVALVGASLVVAGAWMASRGEA